MQIVIDIPNRIYKIVQNKTLNIMDDEILEKAVKTGTPLPKGHGRLIDADAVYDDFERGEYDFEESLEFAPTIIEADKEEQE